VVPELDERDVPAAFPLAALAERIAFARMNPSVVAAAVPVVPAVD
jgi:hypothetical protein